MRLSLKLFFTALLSLLSVALLSSSLAQAATLKGVVKKVSPRSDTMTVKAGKKTFKVKLSPSARVYGSDRSKNGVVGLEDIKKGDKLSLQGKRKGKKMIVSKVVNRSTVVDGDKNTDGIPDNVEVTEVLAKITAVNAEQRALTIDVIKSNDDSLDDISLEVYLPEGARLIVGDRNGDRKRNWNDVKVGDKIMALLAAPVDPEAGANALLVVNLSSAKGKKNKKPSRARTPMGGLVSEVDPDEMTVTFESFNGDPITIQVTDQTKIHGEDLNEDDQVDINDIEPGQQLKALVNATDRENLVAIKIHTKYEDDEEDYNYYDDPSQDDPSQDDPSQDDNQDDPFQDDPFQDDNQELYGEVATSTSEGFLVMAR